MRRFSISDIETLTGIKAHTLRIWEQRYTFFSPKRTSTNIRYYDGEDLRLFLNIATLNDQGIKISKISKMTHDEINSLVNELKEDHYNSSTQVQLLANATLQIDDREFCNQIDACINSMGLQKAMDDVIFPLLRKIGFMWQTGAINPAQEHFASHHISNRIIVATEALPYINTHGGKKYLLFIPSGEQHEIGLLFAKYILKSCGQQVLYLGANVPLESLNQVLHFYEPDYAVCVLTQTKVANEAESEVLRILNHLQDIPLILTGPMITDHPIKSHDRLVVARTIRDFIELVNPSSVSLAS